MFVNRVQAGGHTGGYDAFSFDITDLLKKEQEAEQELLVVVEDPTESQVFRFFSGFLVKVNFRRFQLESNGRVGRDRLGLSSTHRPRESGRWANCISRSRKSLIVNESLMAQQQNNCSDRLVGRGSRGAHHQDICPTAP